MGLLEKGLDIQRQATKPKPVVVSEPKEKPVKTPSKIVEKKTSPTKAAPEPKAAKETAKPASKPTAQKPSAPKPAVKKAVPIHKKVVDEMHPPDDEEIEEAQKEETRRLKAKTHKKPVHKHHARKPQYDEEENEEDWEDDEESEKASASHKKKETVTITPLKQETLRDPHDEKFFLLKIGDFVTGLGRRLSPEQKAELEKMKAAAQQEKQSKKETQKKKKHRLRLIIMLILLGVILEVLILTVLNRLSVVTISPWEGPIVSTLVWIGSQIASLGSTGYSPVLSGAVNVYIISSVVAVVLLLFCAIIFSRKMKKKREAEKAVAQATAAMVAAKQVPTQPASSAAPETSAVPSPEGQPQGEEKKEGAETTGTESKPEDLGPEKSMAEAYVTSIDELYNHIQTTGKITITEIANRFKISKDLAEEWAKILESHELVTVEYPIFSSPILTKYKAPPEEKE